MDENQQEKKQAITPEIKTMLMKNYFFVNKAKFPSFFAGSVFMAYLFVALSIFVVLYFEKVLMTYIFATLFIVVAFFYTFRWFTPYLAQKQKYAKRPTTDQMENWLIKDIRYNVKPQAIEMLSLNPATITPENFIVVPHPVFWKTNEVPDPYITRYNTGEYNVYATYKIQVLALSEKYISFYTCVYNWLDNQIISPYTLEFFFEDISSIRAELQNLDLTRIDAPEADPEKPDEIDRGVGMANVVEVRNKSGEKMNVIVTIPSLVASPRSSLKPEKVMQTLRIMLRHRRYGEEFMINKPEQQEIKKNE